MISHTIQKQIIEMTVESKENGFAVQNQMDAFYKSHLVPLIEEICSEGDDPEKIIRLDRVVVDLGTISLSHFEEEFYRQFEIRFHEILFEQVRESLIDHSQSYSELQSTQKVQRSESSRPRIVDATTRAFELLDHFFHTGIFPWWVGRQPMSFLDTLCRELLKDQRQPFISFLKMIFVYPDARARFVHQCSSDITENVDRMLRDESFFLNQRKELDQIPHHQADIRHRTVRKKHRRETGPLSFDHMKSVSRSQDDHPLKNEDQSGLQIHERDKKASTIRSWNVEETSDEKAANSLESRSLSSEHSLPHSGQILSDSRIKIDHPIEEVYVNNSGLVLLWPYFKTLFQNLQLFKNSKFKDIASQMKAVHLLQYLISGEEASPEYMLILNKLLCGVDVFYPVPRYIALSNEEKKEAAVLLDNVIAHWTTLKRTSIDGFRRSFLAREGVLQEKENSWLLRVDRKGYDMLLNQLPWTLSVIKLSWMKSILYVDW